MPEETARAVGEAIGEGDLFAKGLGVMLEDIRPGYARATMTVREDMSNKAGICHGGAIFTLADTCFAYACNSRNFMSLAMTCQVSFLAPGRLGDRLTAVCEETHLSGRNGIYDVTVSNGEGETIALFRGNSRQIKGHVVPQ